MLRRGEPVKLTPIKLPPVLGHLIANAGKVVTHASFCAVWGTASSDNSHYLRTSTSATYATKLEDGPAHPRHFLHGNRRGLPFNSDRFHPE